MAKTVVAPTAPPITLNELLVSKVDEWQDRLLKEPEGELYVYYCCYGPNISRFPEYVRSEAPQDLSHAGIYERCVVCYTEDWSEHTVKETEKMKRDFYSIMETPWKQMEAVLCLCLPKYSKSVVMYQRENTIKTSFHIEYDAPNAADFDLIGKLIERHSIK